MGFCEFQSWNTSKRCYFLDASYRHFQDIYMTTPDAFCEMRVFAYHAHAGICRSMTMHAQNFSLQRQHPTGLWKFEETPVRRKQRLSEIRGGNKLFGARGNRGKSRVLSSRGTADASRGAFRYTFFTFHPVINQSSPYVRRLIYKYRERIADNRIFLECVRNPPTTNAEIK